MQAFCKLGKQDVELSILSLLFTVQVVTPTALQSLLAEPPYQPASSLISSPSSPESPALSTARLQIFQRVPVLPIAPAACYPLLRRLVRCCMLQQQPPGCREERRRAAGFQLHLAAATSHRPSSCSASGHLQSWDQMTFPVSGRSAMQSTPTLFPLNYQT